MHPLLVPAFGATIAVQVLFPLLLAAWVWWRFRVPRWISYFLFGALVFFVSQVVVRIPLLQYLQSRFAGPLRSSPWILFAWIVFSSLTAGLFEEGGRYLGYRFLWKKGEERTWSQALLYGAGHGGIESIWVAWQVGMVLIYLLQGSWKTIPLTPVEQQGVEALLSTPWWSPLLSALERVLTIAVHLSFSVLVLQVFRRGRFGWWWLAVGGHALVDLLVAGLLAQYGPRLVGDAATVWLAQGALLLFAGLSVWTVLRLRPSREGKTPAASSPREGV